MALTAKKKKTVLGLGGVLSAALLAIIPQCQGCGAGLPRCRIESVSPDTTGVRVVAICSPAQDEPNTEDLIEAVDAAL